MAVVTQCSHPDAELDPLLRRDARVARCHSPLHLDRATHCVNNAWEPGKKAVARVS